MKEIATIKKQVGIRWFNLAQAWSRGQMPTTKQDRDIAIRAIHPKHTSKAKGKNIGSLVDSLAIIESLAEKIKDARRARRTIQTSKGARVLPANLFTPVPAKASAERRLGAYIRINASDAVRQATKSPARDEIIIKYSTNPKDLGMTTAAFTCRPYGGSYKTWSAKEYTRTVTVPRRYLSRVVNRGLSVIGGMMTLDAAPVDSPVRGVQVYAATWLVESRGYECKTVQGFIAIDGDRNFHAKTLRGAISGLQGKSTENRSLGYLKGRLDRALRVCAGRTFGISDAKRLGFCEFGITSWCNRVGINPDAGATIDQIVAGYRQAPLTEARQFILHYCN